MSSKLHDAGTQSDVLQGHSGGPRESSKRAVDTHAWEKRVLASGGARKTGFAQAKERNWSLVLTRV